MATFVVTPKPKDLLSAIKSAIDEGHIKTWKYDKDGDLIHTTGQWEGKAWLRPVVSSGALNLGIIGPKNANLSSEAYAVYHGRFIEMLLAHFDKQFSSAQATAQMEPPDIYK